MTFNYQAKVKVRANQITIINQGPHPLNQNQLNKRFNLLYQTNLHRLRRVDEDFLRSFIKNYKNFYIKTSEFKITIDKIKEEKAKIS